MKTAVVFGASGLVGSCLVNLLLEEPEWVEVILFLRKEIEMSHQKLKQVVIDFSKADEWKSQIRGDYLFCCLGTTIKKAGSRKEFRKIDLEIPVLLGKIALENHFSTYLLISTIGADFASGNFYLKTKGEAEEELKKSGIEHLYIFRPSFLLGPRKEFRLGEIIGKYIARILSPLMLGGIRKYRPVHAEVVARAMLNVSMKNSSEQIFESDKIQQLGKKV